VHAASELTAAVAAERPYGPDRTDRMGTKTGSLARFVQVLFVLSIPPTHSLIHKLALRNLCETIHRVCEPPIVPACDTRQRNATVANGITVGDWVLSYCRMFRA
jgi:hypothetical protein